MPDTIIVFLKEFFENVNLKKISDEKQKQKKHEKLPSMQRFLIKRHVLGACKTWVLLKCLQFIF